MTITPVGVSTSFINSGAAIDIPKHASALTGDYMLALLTRTGSNTNMSSLPGNFVAETATASGTSLTHLPFRGTVQSGDPSTYTFTFPGSLTEATGAILFLRDQHPTSPLDAVAGPDNDGAASDTSIPLPGMTTTVADDYWVALVSNSQNATFGVVYTWPGTGWVLKAQVEGSIAARCAVVGVKQLAALSPSSDVLTSSVAGVHAATSVAISPAPPPPALWTMADDSAETGKKRRLQNWLM